jgi:hypothetical protein
MDYRNTETKLDQLVGYFNEEKINLSPIFQRGRVWTLPLRKELIKNIVRRRPIPAIFLYKDEAGSKYSYNILDGKQRLESVVMFIASGNKEFAINTWKKYIFGKDHRRNAGFAVDLKDGKGARRFAQFDEQMIRELREYPIPTIEIALNENTNLDEIINLFVDINQYGAKVTRLNIVRALRQKDPLLEDIYQLIAEKQSRNQDVFTKKKKTCFVNVLKRLKIISGVTDAAAQADRMWEKLLELTLFVRSGGRHRKPSEILKTFIKSADTRQEKLTKGEKAKLTAAFTFLERAYKNTYILISRLATDQTHFYTLASSLLASDLLASYKEDVLIDKLAKFARLIDGADDPALHGEQIAEPIKRYLDLSTEKTTDAARRKERQQQFTQALKILPGGHGAAGTTGILPFTDGDGTQQTGGNP